MKNSDLRVTGRERLEGNDGKWFLCVAKFALASAIAGLRTTSLFPCRIVVLCVQADLVMAKFDSDGDGRLDFDEFKKMLKK